MTYPDARRVLPRPGFTAFVAVFAFALLALPAFGSGGAAAAQEADSVAAARDSAPEPADTVVVAPDSVLDRLRRLEEHVRSLRAALDSAGACAAEDTARQADDLAELREAARAAAEEASAGGGRSGGIRHQPHPEPPGAQPGDQRHR